ncbi:VOC family protein [Geminicoccaceae bacterium 1502E]|nr:VOC family protein [Geminicoccaceae bacterium 1502E]
MAITALDHLVLTVNDEAATRRFYVEGLAMRWVEFGAGRHALAFGQQKINLHYAGREREPRALLPTPGSGDLCLLTDEDLDRLAARMTGLGFPVIEGPVQRTGATRPILSIYFRDPDGNLIEVSR